jgi:hypothetical protein
VLRAAGKTETTEKNIQDWPELDEGDPGFQLLTQKEIATAIFFYSFSSALPILLFCPCICFLGYFCLLGLPLASLIRIIG